MPEFHKAAQLNEITAQTPKSVDVQGRRIALFNVGGTICAIDDVCSHHGGPLSEGTLEGDEVECPWHGARFNVRTGAYCCPPADENVGVYRVRVVGEDVEVEI